MQKIKYILPDFMSLSRNKVLLDLYDNMPWVTKNNTCIYSFYGVFPNCIWNGGSCFFEYKNSSKKTMELVRDFYNKRGIVVTFTFTNQLIKKEHLHDEYCNQICEVFHNGMNEILVVSPILEKYIRKKYPKYKINRSIINTEKIPFKLDGYYLTVLSKFKNRDFNYLEKMSLDERERTELLCDEYCINNCKYAYQHYKEYAHIQLYNNYPMNSDEYFGKCRYYTENFRFLVSRLTNSNYRITYCDIIEKYLPLGFQYFKLSGRGKYNLSTMESLMSYLIKDEYQMDIRTYILEILIKDSEKEILGSLMYNPDISNTIKNCNSEYLI